MSEKLLNFPEIFTQYIMPAFKNLVNDKVANVRLTLAKVISRHWRNNGKMKNHQDILEIARILQTDKSKDVRFFLEGLKLDGSIDENNGKVQGASPLRKKLEAMQPVKQQQLEENKPETKKIEESKIEVDIPKTEGNIQENNQENKEKNKQENKEENKQEIKQENKEEAKKGEDGKTEQNLTKLEVNNGKEKNEEENKQDTKIEESKVNENEGKNEEDLKTEEKQSELTENKVEGDINNSKNEEKSDENKLNSEVEDIRKVEGFSTEKENGDVQTQSESHEEGI